jgi:hypothetical protein
VVFSGYPASSTNKTDCHDITELLLKVALHPKPLITNPKKGIIDSKALYKIK